MTLPALMHRVGRDFEEMPGLELTLAQASRLWNMTPDDCRSVMDALTASGFLKWTARRTLVRTGDQWRAPAARDASAGGDITV